MTSDPFPGGRSDASLTGPVSLGPPPGRPGPGRAPLGLGAGAFSPGPRRADDRRVAMASLVVAAGYLVAAAVAAGLIGVGATAVPSVAWLPLHLALAGGASTAIAGVMPFFVAALSAGHPAPARLRTASVALVAVGAGLVASHGVAPALGASGPLAALGGLTYLAGIGCTAACVRASGRGGLMARRPIITKGYLLALANIGVGATLGTLMVLGWEPVASRLVAVRAAHAWTNLLGFVSLVILTTLLHFLPTVLGTRIVARRTAPTAVLALALGAPLVVVGQLAGVAAVGGGGAVLTLLAAASLLIEARAVRAARGHWTTDADWHLMASSGLLAAIAWFALGATLASGLMLAHAVGLAGDDRAWSSTVVAGPLVAGWVVQALLASWTHLLPSVGPGGPAEHAAQRALLGRLAAPRLVALNLGTAVLSVGWPTGSLPLTVAGAALVTLAVAVSAALAWAALGVRARP